MNGLKVHMWCLQRDIGILLHIETVENVRWQFWVLSAAILSRFWWPQVITGLLTIHVLQKPQQHLKIFTLKVFAAHSCNACLVVTDSRRSSWKTHTGCTYFAIAWYSLIESVVLALLAKNVCSDQYCPVFLFDFHWQNLDLLWGSLSLQVTLTLIN